MKIAVWPDSEWDYIVNDSELDSIFNSKSDDYFVATFDDDMFFEDIDELVRNNDSFDFFGDDDID